MKPFLLVMAVCLAFAGVGAAQQSPSDAPATKEDVEKYLEVMHSREMMTKTIDAMLKPMHQMTHEQFMKDKDKLPPDFEERMNKEMDYFLKNFPFEEIVQATIPVYQKHFTKGDIDSLLAFYASPTGQKVLREMPAITAESMQTMMPLIRQRVDEMTQRMQKEVAQMMKDSKAKSGEKPQAPPN